MPQHHLSRTVERVTYSGTLDSSDNWSPSTCATGSSPGADNCASGTSTEVSESDYDLIITEVMANADDEDTGEFVELYNNGTETIDLLYWVFYDGDAVDTILGFFGLFPGQRSHNAKRTAISQRRRTANSG